MLQTQQPCYLTSVTRVLSGFLPICQNQTTQGPYEGYIRRTKLNQTGTFISIYTVSQKKTCHETFVYIFAKY